MEEASGNVFSLSRHEFCDCFPAKSAGSDESFRSSAALPGRKKQEKRKKEASNGRKDSPLHPRIRQFPQDSGGTVAAEESGHIGDGPRDGTFIRSRLLIHIHNRVSARRFRGEDRIITSRMESMAVKTVSDCAGKSAAIGFLHVGTADLLRVETGS